jgi:hypothetical protein
VRGLTKEENRVRFLRNFTAWFLSTQDDIMRLYSSIVGFSVLVAASLPLSANVIDTTASWSGSETVAPFGEFVANAASTFGQTFTVGPDRFMTDFSVFLQPWTSGTDDTEFRAYVASWDGTKLISILYSSATTLAPYVPNGPFVEYNFDTGYLPLLAGKRYLWFISSIDVTDGILGDSRVGWISNPNALPGEEAVFGFGTTLTALATNDWGTAGFMLGTPGGGLGVYCELRRVGCSGTRYARFDRPWRRWDRLPASQAIDGTTLRLSGHVDPASAGFLLAPTSAFGRFRPPVGRVLRRSKLVRCERRVSTLCGHSRTKAGQSVRIFCTSFTSVKKAQKLGPAPGLSFGRCADAGKSAHASDLKAPSWPWGRCGKGAETAATGDFMVTQTMFKARSIAINI